MSFELSTVITRLQAEGLSVIHSARTNARRAADLLRERFGGPHAPDFLGLQLSLAQGVEDDLNKLLSLDASHVSEVVGSRLQTRERDEAFAETFEVLAGIRDAVVAIHGEKTRIELFGNVSGLPQNPLELHRLGVRIRDQLTGDELVLPQSRIPGFSPPDRDELAKGLEKPLNRLGKAVDTLGLERKDADGTLLDKTAGVEGTRRTVRFVAGCLASLYGLAGLDELAARIRPKRRGSRQTAGPVTAGGEGASPGAGPAAGVPADSRCPVAPRCPSRGRSGAEPAAPTAPASPTDRAPGVGPARVQSVHAPELVA